MNEIRKIAEILSQINSADEIIEFLNEILTESELSVLSKRWRILAMLSEGRTQREIAKELSVSLCKITRGSKIYKKPNAIVNNYLINGVNYEKNSFKHQNSTNQ